MEILSIAGICVLVSVICLLVRQFNRDVAMLCAVFCGIGVLILVLSQLSGIVGFVDEISLGTYAAGYSSVMLKALGIAYISYIGCEVCKSVGESSLSSALELAGKIGIVIICIPVIRQILGWSTELLFK